MGLRLVIDGEQLSRFMRICRMTNGTHGATIRAMQKRLKISRRTIFRDMQALEALGIEVRLQNDGYRTGLSLAECRRRLERNSLDQARQFLRGHLK